MLVFSGCDAKPWEAADYVAAYSRGEMGSETSMLYPFDGSLFPPESVAPLIRWESCPQVAVDQWLLTVSFSDATPPLTHYSDTDEWRPSSEDWDFIKAHSTAGPAQVLVMGLNQQQPNTILTSASIAIQTSTDEVGAPLLYREVNLPFLYAVKDPTKIQWRFGTIDSPEQPPVILEKLPVCGNCHSFSADGSVLGMDVDYASDKGSYAIAEIAPEITLSKDNIISWSDYKRDSKELTFGLLSQISPDGRYAVSTVKDRSVFVPRDDLAFSQLFFPIKGILAVYDRQTGTITSLPGADDPQYVQSNPVWSPDGKEIIYARTKAYEMKSISSKGDVLLTPEECADFLEGGKEFKFDLYRIPYNDGKGGTPEPIEGASNNGKSNFFARYSPDGKWIVFCQAENYMLLQEDSELFIMPASGGTPRKMACNTGRMNSWHSWSPNSKWMVFSSKNFSLYTQLFLTHIDEAGNSTPPILLEQFTSPDRAGNIPEFVNANPMAIQKIKERFVDAHSLFRAATEYMKQHEYENAERLYRKSLQLDELYTKSRLNLGVVLERQGKLEEAEQEYRKTYDSDPSDNTALVSLATLMYSNDRLDEAEILVDKMMSLDSSDAQVYFLEGMLALKHGNPEKAREAFEITLELNEHHHQAPFQLALLASDSGNAEAAMSYFTLAVERDTDNPEPCVQRGLLLAGQGSVDQGVADFQHAIEIDPEHAAAHHNLGKALLSKGDAKTAVFHLNKAAMLDPLNAETQFYLGMIAARGNQMNEAVTYWQQAVNLAPNMVRAHTNLGIAYLAGKQFDNAEASLKKAMALDESNLYALVNLAEVYACQNRFEDARDLIQQAIARVPADGNAAMKEQLQQRLASYQAGKVFQP